MRPWLKEMRDKQGFTQSQVAIKSRISRSYYTHIENGTKTPSVPVAMKVAEVLNFNWTLFFKNDSSLKEHKEQEVS
ncbi:helix-turn-helix transcriptional regulator [Sporolactobacillus sp. KGMB 08714]|uniref:helix-turn-helix transcriptional regulator n=1 Tax=Sporolactobacillus sp. KGMB 08714 TaxID=3064704 RepID=UPI002FBD64A0